MEKHTHYKTFTDENFHRDVLESSELVLVDFWADWCGPCHVMAPVIEELAAEVADYATVGKLDVDAYPHLAAQYGIRSIPTLLVFKDGQIVDRAVGVVPKQVLTEKLHALVQPA
jgi:thioredoxin 1